MRLIQYAGSEGPYKQRSLTADTLFRLGQSTLEIAERSGDSEAKVLKQINIQRSRRLRLPSPYQVQE